MTVEELSINEGFKGIDGFIESKYKSMIFRGHDYSFPSGYMILDEFLGGGFGASKFISVVGNAGSGKTTFLINFLFNLVSTNMNDYYIVYLDAERSAEERFKGLGFDIDDEMNIIIGTQKVGKYLKPVSIEQTATFLKELTELNSANSSDKKILAVVDSFASLPASAELDAKVIGDNSAGLGIRSRLLSELFRILPGQLERSNVTLFGVNQMRQKIEINPMMKSPNPLGFKRNETMPGGNAMFHFAYQMIYLQPSTHIKNNKTGVKYGRLVNFYIMKNKMAMPFIEFPLFLGYLTGFHNIFSLFYFLKSNKLITSSGPWWKFADADPTINQNFKAAEFIKLYKTDKNFAELVETTIKRFIQSHYYDSSKIESDSDIILEKLDGGESVDESKADEEPEIEEIE